MFEFLMVCCRLLNLKSTNPTGPDFAPTANCPKLSAKPSPSTEACGPLLAPGSGMQLFVTSNTTLPSVNCVSTNDFSFDPYNRLFPVLYGGSALSAGQPGSGGSSVLRVS